MKIRKSSPSIFATLVSRSERIKTACSDSEGSAPKDRTERMRSGVSFLKSKICLRICQVFGILLDVFEKCFLCHLSFDCYFSWTKKLTQLKFGCFSKERLKPPATTNTLLMARMPQSLTFRKSRLKANDSLIICLIFLWYFLVYDPNQYRIHYIII